MLKEVGVGVGLGVIISLIWLGFNIYPLLFLLGLFFLLFKVMDVRGGVKEFPFLSHNKHQIRNSISFDDIGGQNSAKRAA